jgi:glycosyltransferase involved in cell wall biosynthesis
MAPEQTPILYLSYDGLTDPLGRSQILPYLCGLSHEGYQITLVSFEKQNRSELHEGEVLKICENHRIEWVPLKYHKSPPILSTLYDLFVLKLLVKKLLLEKKFAIVHCRSYVTAFGGLWAKKRFRVRFIFDMRGFWVDERVEGGIWNLNNPLFRLTYKFFKIKEKDFIRNCDYIISLTENGKREVVSWNLSSKPIAVIPTCVDMDLFDPGKITAQTAVVKRRLSIDPDQFVLVYIGSWGSWYSTDEMLKFFAVLSSIRRNSILLILTPDEPDLSGYPLLSQVVVCSAERKEVPLYLNIAHAAICFIKPTYSKKASSATKIAEAWAMNLPVVTNAGWGDIDRLEQSGMPLFLCNSDEDYHKVSLSLLQGDRQGKRDMLIGNFDLSSGIQKYSSVYRSLTVI